MNRMHRWLCGSARWRRTLERDIMPWVTEGLELGAHVLEIGPGPGLSTDVIRRHAVHVTCVEVDRAASQALSRRMAGRNVTVVCGDAGALSLADASVDGAISIAMLHHVPSAGLQDRVFHEVARVLRPNGVFAGADARDGVLLRALHLFDTFVPVGPRSLPGRLAAAGFVGVQIEERPGWFRFRCRRA